MRPSASPYDPALRPARGARPNGKNRAVKLATIRTNQGTRCVRLDDEIVVDLGYDDVGALLRQPNWRAVAASSDGNRHRRDGLDFAPLVCRPDKILCVGLNFRSHIVEMGHEIPDHPTLFAKYPSALVGAYDPITLPAVSSKVDYEAELAVVIGRTVRHATPETAGAAIAGYTVLNDVTARDWQYRTTQWLQGKTFEHTTPLGPWLETDPATDEAGGLRVECLVGDELMQSASTAELIFDPATLVAYVSAITTLHPGDVVATGTPPGVGAARDPQRFLKDGDVVTSRVVGVGECSNPCVAEPAPPGSGPASTPDGEA
jgi:acylpyruvate hydrolase